MHVQIEPENTQLLTRLGGSFFFVCGGEFNGWMEIPAL